MKKFREVMLESLAISIETKIWVYIFRHLTLSPCHPQPVSCFRAMDYSGDILRGDWLTKSP